MVTGALKYSLTWLVTNPYSTSTFNLHYRLSPIQIILLHLQNCVNRIFSYLNKRTRTWKHQKLQNSCTDPDSYVVNYFLL